MATLAPSDEKRLAVASPMPDAAPVTITTFPLKRSIMKSSCLARGSTKLVGFGSKDEHLGVRRRIESRKNSLIDMSQGSSAVIIDKTTVLAQGKGVLTKVIYRFRDRHGE